MSKQSSDYISAGKIVQAHGKDGWVKVVAYSRFPNRFDLVDVIYFDTPRGIEGKIITDSTISGNDILLKLKGVDNRESAKELVRQEILVDASDRIRLPDDIYFIDDLLGLNVSDTQGKPLGVLTGVLEQGANEVYVIKGDEREILIPAMGEFVKEVNLDAGTMIVHLWEGM